MGGREERYDGRIIKLSTTQTEEVVNRGVTDSEMLNDKVYFFRDQSVESRHRERKHLKVRDGLQTIPYVDNTS